METQWLGPAFLVLFVVIVGWVIKAAAQRQKELRDTATRLGMHYEKRNGTLGEDGLTRLPMFSKGDIRAENVLQFDVDGATCHVFDYTYVRRKKNGKRSSYSQGTYSCFQLRDRRLPKFRIAHAARGSKNEPIAFDSHPEFGMHYSVTGDDEAAVREVMSLQLLDHLQRRGDDAWAIEGDSEWLGIAKRPAVSMKRFVKAEDMREFRDDIVQIFRAI